MEHVLTMANLRFKPSLFTPRPTRYHFFQCIKVIWPAKMGLLHQTDNITLVMNIKKSGQLDL